MPTRLALSVTIEVARAIEYAHSKGVIHRDIKPHNVLVHRDGACRVTDFGIARLSDDALSVTKTGAVMGTWGYMAPEQRTDAKGVDERADVYALGATLYSLVTNTIPVDLFAADRDVSLMKSVPSGLATLIMSATHYTREQRFDSVSALRMALQDVLKSESGASGEHPPLIQGVLDKRLAPTLEMIEQAIPLTVHWSSEQQRLTGVRGQTLMPMETFGVAHAPTMAPGEWGPLETEASESMLKPSVPLTEIPLASEGSFKNSEPSGRPWVWALAVSPAIFGAIFGAIALFVLVPKMTPPVVQEVVPEEVLKTIRDTPPPQDSLLNQAAENTVDVPVNGRRRRSVASEQPKVPVVQSQCIKATKAPTDIRAGQTVAFVARLCVNASRASVTLVYRPVGRNKPWQRRKMTNLAGQFRFAVTITEQYPEGMEYYIETKGASFGSVSRPKFIPTFH